MCLCMHFHIFNYTRLIELYKFARVSASKLSYISSEINASCASISILYIYIYIYTYMYIYIIIYRTHGIVVPWGSVAVRDIKMQVYLSSNRLIEVAQYTNVSVGLCSSDIVAFTCTKVHSRSVDPQKNVRNYLIIRSIFKFSTPHRSSSQRRSFDIYYISVVGSKNKKLAVLP